MEKKAQEKGVVAWLSAGLSVSAAPGCLVNGMHVQMVKNLDVSKSAEVVYDIYSVSADFDGNRCYSTDADYSWPVILQTLY